MLEISTRTQDDVNPYSSPLKQAVELPPWIDVIAFSPVRWDDAYQKPRLLMTRCAKNRRVFFFEEPRFDAVDEAYFELTTRENVNIVIPHLRPEDSNPDRSMGKLIGLLLSLAEIHRYIFWYFSPASLAYSDQFAPECVVYDCINEPGRVRRGGALHHGEQNRKLKELSDLIFTTDLNLYLKTCRTHRNVHLFVDGQDPRKADWDALWQQMNRILSETMQQRRTTSRMMDQ
jgi:UDP-galactopyranose mutase